MPDDISATDWFVIVCALFLGFGLVRFWLSTLVERNESSAQPAEDQSRGAREQDSERPGAKEREQDTPSGFSTDSTHWTVVLDLPADASVADIRGAYRRKMAQYHPDKVATLGPELKVLAEQMAKRINGAHDQAMHGKG